MLNWDELGHRIASDLQDYDYTNALEAISAFSYEFSRTSLVDKLSSELLIDSVKPGSTHKSFCELSFDIVCTTNIEFLLEQGYALIPRPCRPIVNENQLSISNNEKEVRLLKLHGDLHHPDKLVVTEEDYDNYFNKNPMLATYMANLLITRTPLFVGYSLDDSDFRQIWQLIKDRLGNLRRQAYVLKVDCSPYERARFERRGVKVINIKGAISDYPQILTDVFQELRDYWNKETVSTTISEEATLAELAMPNDTNNRLCFFSVPMKVLSFYKKYIFPLVTNYGLVPISADDVISIGDNWTAKVAALMDKSEFFIIDASSKTTAFELGVISNKRNVNDKLLLIKSENAPSISDLHGFLFISRPENPFDDADSLVNSIDRWLRDVAQPMEQTYSVEPKRLYAKKEYRAAIISAMTLLEISLRKVVGDYVDAKTQIPSSIYAVARDKQIISKAQYTAIMQWSRIRNSLVHTETNTNGHEARKIVNGVDGILNSINT